jgi:two-component system, NtrC family, sensor kinase
LAVRTGVQDAYASVTVSDNGPGIHCDIRRRIFDPFFTTKPDGTGLGLSIAYGIMEEHGGRIVIESYTGGGQSPHSGTTVRLLLPITGRLGERTRAAREAVTS